jgi:hypothetical protein
MPAGSGLTATQTKNFCKHIRDNQADGSQLHDLIQVLPSLTLGQVRALLRELKNERRFRNSGRGKGGRWFIEDKTGDEIGVINGDKPN